MTPQRLRQLTIWLGCVSSLGTLVSLLALTDIYHGEADLSQEWMALRFAFGAIIAFHIAAFLALTRLRNP